MKFNIKQIGSIHSIPLKPTVGKWYCGFEIRVDDVDSEYEMSGSLGRYESDGEFYDESDNPVDMHGYDFLVEQI